MIFSLLQLELHESSNFGTAGTSFLAIGKRKRAHCLLSHLSVQIYMTVNDEHLWPAQHTFKIRQVSTFCQVIKVEQMKTAIGACRQKKER